MFVILSGAVDARSAVMAESKDPYPLYILPLVGIPRFARNDKFIQRFFSASSSSRVRGQSDPSRRERLRSASTFPPVWQRAQ